ncbi:MAG: AzlC family ABC transporter permease [Synergistaceae bacterium]|nr:AzlC family ABC transporter permease [Synergistaceae bacterium]
MRFLRFARPRRSGDAGQPSFIKLFFIELSSVKKGVRWALPVVLGYAPIGMAYGLLARQTGLGVRATLGLSLFVFAGASQFMAISMLSGGAGAAAVIGATFIVNFRHVLMSAAVAPRLTSWRPWQRAALGTMMTDESFALHSIHFARGDLDPAAAITLNLAAWVTWAAAGTAGHRLGALIERPEAWGLDFALPAMFIGLLLPSCGRRSAVAAALCGGAASVALCLLGAGNQAAFFGALAGATAGVCVKDRTEEAS